MNAFADNPGESGIRGTVLMGAMKPGPATPGDPVSAPASVAFSVRQYESQVTTFRSAEDGSFEVSLPPGDYLVVPHKNTPIPFPEKQSMSVTVPVDGYAQITIHLETGMK
jgi:hypothetical protein